MEIKNICVSYDIDRNCPPKRASVTHVNDVNTRIIELTLRQGDDKLNLVNRMAYLFELLQTVEALDIRVKIIHPAPECRRLLTGIARRSYFAFRTVEASSVRALVRMAHHCNDGNA